LRWFGPQNKAQAPEPLVPTNRFGSPEGSIKHFVESRATTEDFLKIHCWYARSRDESPLGKLDGMICDARRGPQRTAPKTDHEVEGKIRTFRRVASDKKARRAGERKSLPARRVGVLAAF